MHFKLLKSADSQVVFSSAAGAEVLSPIKTNVVKEQAKDLKMPGFRAGKVPLGLAEKQLDQRQLQSHVLDHALGELYFEAVKQLKIKPVGRPHIEIKKFVPFTDLAAEFTVAVVPDAKLPDYKKMRLPFKKSSLSEDDVNSVLDSLKQRLAERGAVSRPAQNGDEALIDFSGQDESGRPVKGADGRDYPLILGSNTFIPGFEEKLIGHSSGEELTFDLTFPENYNVQALAGRVVTFKVKINKVNELKVPALNDDFAAKAGPFKNLSDLKADIKKQLTNERQIQAEHEYEEQLIKTISAKTKLTPPPLLVDEQVERDLQSLKQNLTYRGQTYPEFIESQGSSEADYATKNLRPLAAEKVKAALIISAIAEQEGLSVTNEELEDYISQLKTNYHNDPAMLNELSKAENRRDLAGRLLSRKTFAKLRDYAIANNND